MRSLYRRWLELPTWARILTVVLAPVALVVWGIYLGASNVRPVLVTRDFEREVEREVERVEDQIESDQDDPTRWRLE